MDQEILLRMGAELLIGPVRKSMPLKDVAHLINERLVYEWMQIDGAQGLRVKRAQAWLRLEKEQRGVDSASRKP